MAVCAPPQMAHRAIVVEIDNRAREMGRGFALPTVEHGNLERLEAMIAELPEIKARPPRDLIGRCNCGLIYGRCMCHALRVTNEAQIASPTLVPWSHSLWAELIGITTS